MENIATLLTEQFKVSLVPLGALRYDALGAIVRLKPGDHIVVLVGGDGGFGHHGLYLGYNNDRLEVAEFGSESRKSNNKIRIITYEEFAHGYECVYVIPYTDDCDHSRPRSIDLARKMVTCKSLHDYDLLRWNCETFVLMCKTGQYRQSDQVIKVFEAIRKDIGSKNSTIGHVISGIGRSSKQCVLS